MKAFGIASQRSETLHNFPVLFLYLPVALSQALHFQCRYTSFINIKSPRLLWTQSALEYSQAFSHAVVRYLESVLLQFHLQIPTYSLTRSSYDSYSARPVKIPSFIFLSSWLLQNFIFPFIIFHPYYITHISVSLFFSYMSGTISYSLFYIYWPTQCLAHKRYSMSILEVN